MAKRRAGLDQTDRKILNVLQRDSSLTFAEVAELAGTTAPTCLRRVKSLKKRGVIQSEISLLNTAKIGDNLTAITEIRLNSHSAQARDRAIKSICDIPEVILCYNVSGNRDILIISQLNDMEDFEEVISEPLSNMQEVQSVNSYFAIKNHKFKPFINFDETR